MWNPRRICSNNAVRKGVKMAEIKTIMVVGAGTMGCGIAQVCIESGFQTLLVDTDIKTAQEGKDKVSFFLNRKVEKRIMNREEMINSLKLLVTGNSFIDGKDSDLVIEAINENVELKINIFKELDNYIKSDSILASNTSTISITMLGGATKRPEKVIGMHFFLPPPVMKLIEIIPGICTERETIDTVIGVTSHMGKTHVLAPDSSGFLVNRLLVPMWNEAAFLVMEGSLPEDIDTAMKLGANIPMGPLELADFAGLDTVLSVMTQMYTDLGESKYRPCPLLKKMVYANMLGRKTKKGFYNYD